MELNKHALNRIAVKVLEDWAMMLVDIDEEVSFSEGSEYLVSTIVFKGIINGEVSIVAPESFLSTLAGNVLGIDENEATQEEKEDAFREMNNVLTGNFLTEAYGADIVFDVILPTIKQANAIDLKSLLESRVVFKCSADSNPVACTFKVNN
jgi:chemotaxis protein CheY-P-specific phosphatase CheC